MIYLKKDGAIKKHYILACKCILNGAIRKVEEIDSYEHIKDTYYCYSISFPNNLCIDSRKRQLLRKHISDISKGYGLKSHTWYSLKGWECMDYKNQDTLFENMQKDIKRYLGEE